ncbi:MAG: hypothetical protein JW734_00550, partial [Candidatus Omnitrophica bacterium]|nr:hypothetical protein [Candidatus Omnitrophota bacterium]
MIKKLKSYGFFPAVFILFIVLHAFLIFNLRIYPFVDLPNHLTEATVLKFYHEPANQFDRFYTIRLFPEPNIFHILFLSLRIFPSVEYASKFFYCLYVILLPLSIFLAIRKLKGNKWVALLSFLFLYNFSLCWGFSGFTFFIPVFFFLFCFIIDYLDRDRLSDALKIAAILLLIYFIHLLGAFFSLFFFLTCLVFRYRKSFKMMLGKSLAAVPS